jgi:hypothetical protein
MTFTERWKARKFELSKMLKSWYFLETWKVGNVTFLHISDLSENMKFTKRWKAGKFDLFKRLESWYFLEHEKLEMWPFCIFLTFQKIWHLPNDGKLEHMTFPKCYKVIIFLIIKVWNVTFSKLKTVIICDLFRI